MSDKDLLVASAASSITGGDLFPRTVLPISLEIQVEQPQGRDYEFNRGVDRLIPADSEHRQGILVIQTDHGRYTIRVDPDVPCGIIQESRL